jgi:DNA-binding transcriptional regulator YiaG
MCDAPIPYRACGLDGIFLCNGYEREQIDGEWFTYVKDIEGLHRAIALHLVANRKTLTPKEIRFIRTAMDKTQAEIARDLGVTSQTVARWEKGQTEELPGPADRMLRILFVVSIMKPEDFSDYVSEQTEMLDELDQSVDVPVQFSRDPADTAWDEGRRVLEHA